jgi:hypothetical protein
MRKDLLHKSNKTGNCLFYFYTDNSIQISEATHDLLQSIGGFRMRERRFSDTIHVSCYHVTSGLLTYLSSSFPMEHNASTIVTVWGC